MTAVYGARPIRRRRTKGEVEQLERQILDVLEDDHPQSVRHVFYRLTDPRLPEPIDKTELGYRVVQKRLTVMRRAGQIPYGWISDATRWRSPAKSCSSLSAWPLSTARPAPARSPSGCAPTIPSAARY
jgi:hypothetical protein